MKVKRNSVTGLVACFSRVASVGALVVASIFVAAVQAAPQNAVSIRDVFGINAPDARGDVADEYRERSEESLNPSPDGAIPDLNERDSGPRIIVKKFVFERLEEIPDFGITRDGVEAEAERLRVIYMKEDLIQPDGYTLEEKEEITAYLRDIGEQSIENVTHEDMQTLLEIIREQKQRRGMSFADLEEVANRLTLYYRLKGLFLARVQLPAQEVLDGVVTLSVMEGRLGQVSTFGQKKYSTDTIEWPFASVIGDIVTSEEIEEAMYLVNDMPGLNVLGAFSAGDNPGETRLNLNVRDEDDFSYMLRLDNHGSTYTGNTRLYADFGWFNPIGFGDSMNIAYMRSEDVEGRNLAEEESLSQLGIFRYSLPFFSPRTRMTFSYDYNEFTIVDENGGLINYLDLHGSNRNMSLGLDYKILRTRGFNMRTGLALTDKRTRIDSYLLPSKDRAVGAQVNFYVDGLSDIGLRMLNTATFTVQYGRNVEEVAEGTDERFTKVSVESSSLFFIPLPFTDQFSRLATTMRLQHSDSALPSFEQMGLGGANAVRAFHIGDFSADKAVFIGNEWYFNLPAWSIGGGRTVNDILQFGLVLDFAYGIQNGGYYTDSGDLADDEWARMSGAGLVVKAGWSDRFASKITFVTPLAASSSLDPEDGNGAVKPLNDTPEAIEVYADVNFFF